MIDLGTISGLHQRAHELRAYCRYCDRWAILDLAAMIRSGHGDRHLPITPRCQYCGQRGQLQVRPPMPAWTNRNGWMDPG